MGHIDRKNVTLTAEHASLIAGVVAAGEYASPDAVVEEALREWQERRDNFGYSLAELRRLVQQGIDSGPGRDGPAVMARIKAEARRRFEANRRR
jgi:antitoxin ParD1/3/4